MGAITDLADLFISVSEYTGRADFAHLFPRFVALAEDRLSKALRTDAQEVSATLTTAANGRVALPSGFRQFRSVKYPGGLGVLHTTSLQHLETFQPSAGTPAAFAISGGELVVVPASAVDLEVHYYAGVPRLTGDAPTNAMLDRYPDCYLYGVILETMIWARDMEGAAVVEKFLERAIGEAVIDDERRRFTLARVRVRGVTP